MEGLHLAPGSGIILLASLASRPLGNISTLLVAGLARLSLRGMSRALWYAA